jgi:hypothetical protein
MAEQVSEPIWPLRNVGEPPKLAEMIFVANDEADHIEGIELARAAAGDKSRPDRMRRAEVFRALARFLLAIEPKLDEVKRIITEKPRRSYGGKR